MTRSGRAAAMAWAAPTAASMAPIPTGVSSTPRAPRKRRRRGSTSGSKAETTSVRANSDPHRLESPDALLDRGVSRQQVHERRRRAVQRVDDEEVRGGGAGELVRAEVLRAVEPLERPGQVLRVAAQRGAGGVGPELARAADGQL